MNKNEASEKLASALKDLGIERVGTEGEILVKKSEQSQIASGLEKEGFGMVLVSGKSDEDSETSMFKVVTGPRSIKDIISLVVPEDSDSIAERIRVDPVLRAVQMNMIAFD